MHGVQTLGDRVLRAVFLFRQPLDSPDIRKKLADLLFDVVAVLLGHDSRMQMQINKLLPMRGATGMPATCYGNTNNYEQFIDYWYFLERWLSEPGCDG